MKGSAWADYQSINIIPLRLNTIVNLCTRSQIIYMLAYQNLRVIRVECSRVRTQNEPCNEIFLPLEKISPSDSMRIERDKDVLRTRFLRTSNTFTIYRRV